MRPGYFFKELPGTSLLEDPILFSYTALLENEHYFPVYLAIHDHKLEFNLSTSTNHEHATLFELFFSDHPAPDGKLARQLQQLKTSGERHTVEKEISTYTLSKTLEHNSTYSRAYRSTLSKHINPKNDSIQLPGHETENNGDLKICLATLFLDFLFDLKHSDIFELSPHHEKLYRITRENPLLSDLIAMLESWYWEAVMPVPEKSGSLESWMFTQRMEATENWISAITKPIVGHETKLKEWLPDGYERELFRQLEAVVEIHEEDLRLETDLKKRKKPTYQKVWNQSADWFTKRYTFSRITAIVILGHAYHQILMASLLFFTLCLLSFNNLSHNNTQFLVHQVVTQGIIGACILICILLMFSSTRNKFRVPQYTAIAILIMPKALIGALLAWGASAKIKINQDLQCSLPIDDLPFWLIFTALVSIPGLYLFREIKSVAPDLHINKTVIRTCSASLLLLTTIFLVGLLFHSVISYLTKKPLDWDTIIRSTPFVYFSAIFLEILFKGKGVTGTR